jgi:hypothetical protein
MKDAWELPDKANGNLEGNSESGELAEAEELVKEKVVLVQTTDSVETLVENDYPLPLSSVPEKLV